MDASSSRQAVDYVLGRTVVSAAQIDTKGFAQIWEVILETVKPVLKYYRSFELLEDQLNCPIGGFARRITSSASFPGGISVKTRVFRLGEVMRASALQSLVRTILLLTDSGDVLVWSAAYELQGQGERKSPNEVAVQCVLTRLEIGENNFGLYRDWNKCLDTCLIDGLLDLLRREDKTVEEKYEQARDMKSRGTNARAILARYEPIRK
jgi:hypothetical protein